MHQGKGLTRRTLAMMMGVAALSLAGLLGTARISLDDLQQ